MTDQPDGIDTHGYWLRLLRNWDHMMLIRPTHLERHGEFPRAKSKSTKDDMAIRRMSVTLPLTVYARLMARMEAISDDEEQRSSRPIFDVDFLLPPHLPPPMDTAIRRGADQACRIAQRRTLSLTARPKSSMRWGE